MLRLGFMKKTLLFFFLFFGLVYSVSIEVLQDYPANMVAGSIYEAKYSFSSNYEGEYEIYINISGVGANETFVSSGGANCTEASNGSHVCTNSMGIGENVVSVFLQYHPYLMRGSYPIATYFKVPQVHNPPPAPTQSYSGGGSSGGGSFAFPRSPPHKEEPKNETKEEPALNNETEKEPLEPEKEQPSPPKEPEKEPDKVASEPEIVIEKSPILKVEASKGENKDIVLWVIGGGLISAIGLLVVLWVWGKK